MHAQKGSTVLGQVYLSRFTESSARDGEYAETPLKCLEYSTKIFTYKIIEDF